MTNHIGYIIRDLREKCKLSRAALAEGVCSEKYIYLIEKGERTPSSEIADVLGDKLGADLFSYYAYMNCQNPIAMHDAMREFQACRHSSRYEDLAAATRRAETLPDFQKKPWCYELEVNRLSVLVLLQKDFTGALPLLKDLTAQVELLYPESVLMAHVYLLLSTCLQNQRDMEGAARLAEKVSGFIHRKRRMPKFEQIIIALYLNLLTYYYFAGNPQQAYNTGHELLTFQKEAGRVDSAHFSFVYLAFCCHAMHHTEETLLWLRKGIYTLLLVEKPADIRLLVTFPAFGELLAQYKCHEFVREFVEKYHYLLF